MKIQQQNILRNNNNKHTIYTTGSPCKFEQQFTIETGHFTHLFVRNVMSSVSVYL